MKSILFGILLPIITLTSLNASEQISEGEADPLSPASVEKFFDQQIQPAIDKQEIIGAIVAVVQGDNALLVKGYGITDITETKPKPVDPEQTLFRTASVTKIFVAMAVMQMIEEGKLSLDGNVNDYLKSFQAPTIDEQPLTIRHLLGHQAGYDTDISDILFPKNSQIVTTAEQAKNSLIPINSPGKYFVYDNFGVGLLGMVMAEVDKKPFAKIMDERILKPLGMTNSVIGVPDNRDPDVQKCHEIRDDRWVSCGKLLMLDSIQAAGSLSITAADMSRFLTALLNKTRHANGRILSEEGFADYINMDLNRNHPLLSGIGRLTLEIPPVGSGMFGHSGHVPGFVSNLMVSPADNIAVYISVNGHAPWNDHLLDWIKGDTEKQQKVIQSGGKVLHSSLAFLQQHNPIANANARPLDYPGIEKLTAFTETEIEKFAGRYLSMRARTTSHLSVQVLNSLKGGIEIDVTDGSLAIDGAGEYTQQLPRLFIDKESGRKWTFLSSDLGTILAGGVGSEHLKLAWHQQPWVNIWPGIIAMVLLLIISCWLMMKSQNNYAQRLAFSIIVALLLLTVGIALEFNFGRFLVMDEFWSSMAIIWRGGLKVLSLFFLIAAILAVLIKKLTTDKLLLPLVSVLAILIASWQFYWDLAL